MSKSEETETTPIDEIIMRVRSYVENPKMVTPDTMRELLGELEDLKSVLDGEDEEDESTSDSDEGGISSEIRRGMRKGRNEDYA